MIDRFTDHDRKNSIDNKDA